MLGGVWLNKQQKAGRLNLITFGLWGATGWNNKRSACRLVFRIHTPDGCVSTRCCQPHLGHLSLTLPTQSEKLLCQTGGDHRDSQLTGGAGVGQVGGTERSSRLLNCQSNQGHAHQTSASGDKTWRAEKHKNNNGWWWQWFPRMWEHTEANDVRTEELRECKEGRQDLKWM